ncbi:MAG: tetratricopeptide repeat protein, partial [Planctomycetia bacterium]|nr:tetratricopeptide repeat protein [Planctomycetia bacterium]
VTEAREAVAEHPENAVAWTELGDALREAGGDAAGAADAYERALDLDPFAEQPAQELASLAPERLLPRIRERWRELPDDERLTILATTLLRTGHVDEATAAFFRCRKLDTAWLLAGLASLAPGPALASIDTRLALGDDDALHLARVDALAALGRVPEAREALAPLVTPDSGFAADTWERLLALDPERAITNHGAERATLAPNAEFRVYLGEALRRVGREAEAKELVGPFLAGNPDWVGWEFVAPLLTALDPETRLPELERATRDPDSAGESTPWRQLAEAYALLGRTADARRAYDEAIAREPDDMPLRIRRLRVR